MNPIHILFDYDVFGNQHFGGISRYYRELIPRLSRRQGFSVSAVPGLHINAYGLVRSTGEYQQFLGVRRPDGWIWRMAAKLLNPLALRIVAVATRPQIYHQTGYVDHLSFTAAARIITLQDLIWHRYPRMVHPARSITPRKDFILAADGVICASEHTRRDAIEILRLPLERSTVIHHANALTVQPSSERLYDEPYLLFVGKRSGYKNFATLLQAVARDSRLRSDFRIVTFGPPHTPHELSDIHDLGLTGRVLAVEGSDDFTLATLYAHAEAFVYPSLYEGFGIPLLEAMHYGCPVVAAAASSLPEIAGDAAIFFDPRHPDDLARALHAAIYDSALHDHLRSAGPIREARFSWDETANRTAEFYRTVLGIATDS